MLANRSPTAYQQAGLPAIMPGATAAQRRGWLTNPAITRAYLDSDADTSALTAAAVRRYGQPLGPPSVMPGGVISQAFADIVLEVTPGNGGSVHAATVTRDALAAGVLEVPALARAPQPPPPLPIRFTLGPAGANIGKTVRPDAGGCFGPVRPPWSPCC